MMTPGVFGQLLHHVLDAGGVVGAVAPGRCKHKNVVDKRLDNGHTTGDFEVVGEEMVRIGFKRNADNTCVTSWGNC